MEYNMQQIKIGSRWSGSSRTQFVVRNLITDDRGTWVHYINYETEKDYNCLIGAFLQRFTEDVT